jgi:hypothetical protein
VLYVEILKDDAKEQYRNDVMVWAALAPHAKKDTKPPDLPAILK